MEISSENSSIEKIVNFLNSKQNQTSNKTRPADDQLWTSSSFALAQLDQQINQLNEIQKKSLTQPENISIENIQDETNQRELKLYTKEQFSSHINRIYPFHIDFFTNKCSALTVEQHRMGLYTFYDINQGHLQNNIDKEISKKTDRGKNMKRMNGLLLNEHRLFNQAAKQYAIEHFQRDYQIFKAPIEKFVENWLKRKSNILTKPSIGVDRFYSLKLTIPLNCYDSLNSVSFVNLSTILRLGSIPHLTIPDRIERLTTKCSDDRDKVVSNRFNSAYRLTNLVDDPNILSILSEDPSIDVVLSKSSLNCLIELFSKGSTGLSLPVSVREFLVERISSATTNQQSNRKKVIFIDKKLRQKFYTKRELNKMFYQRSFRSLLLSSTGGKREETNKPFHHLSFTDKLEYRLTEFRKKSNLNQENKFNADRNQNQQENEDQDEDEDEDQQTMIISTDGDEEQQQKHFHKTKKRLIHSPPILQETIERNLEFENNNEPVPVVTQIKLSTPVQGNYEYSLWQLGTLKILIRCSFHGFISEMNNDQLVSCYAKLEYQTQFGLEQITDEEYRYLWLQSYLRHGSSIILGRINVFQQQLLKVEKINYENIEQNLQQLQIDMLKPLTKIYGLLYGLQSLETKNYLLTSTLNEDKIELFESVANKSDESVIDLETVPIESNNLLSDTDLKNVPWIPLTATHLLPYHLEFERIPLTFRPRTKRCYDIEIKIPANRIRPKLFDDEQKSNEEKKKRKKIKKKKFQRRKKNKGKSTEN